MNRPVDFNRWSAVVYDLDGTIVRLDVDWDAVGAAVADRYRAAGVSVDSADLWTMLDRAPSVGLEAAVESTIAAFERPGAIRSARLPLADRLRGESRPAGICSLNSERACRLALETHDLDSSVRSIVGRDTVMTWKPDPEPLLTAIAEMDGEPHETVFVGDSDRDRRTAERAGTAFVWAHQLR